MKRGAPMKPSKILPRKVHMRSSKKRPSAAARSAREQDCAICLPGCPNDRATVVLCHLRQFSGGGTAIKPDDAEAVYGDDYCHSRIDGRVTNWERPPDLWEYIARAIVRTQRVMRARGVLIFKGEAA